MAVTTQYRGLLLVVPVSEEREKETESMEVNASKRQRAEGIGPPSIPSLINHPRQALDTDEK